MQCPRCEGSGRCSDCDGQGFVPCPACEGRGQRQSPRLGTYPCRSCQASGKVECSPKCPSCQGSGEITSELQRQVRDKYQVPFERPRLWVAHLTRLLIIVCLAVWVYGEMSPEAGRALELRFGNISGVWEREPWRLLTSMFLHTGLLHLLSNMLALGQFGSLIERDYGSLRFGLIYLISGLTGSLLSSYAHIHWSGEIVLSLGASGALFGLVGTIVSAHLFHGRYDRAMISRQLSYLGLFTLFTLNSNLDHWCHLGGFLGGFAAAWLLTPPRS